MPAGLRVAGALAALSGLAAVVLPWTTGVEGPPSATTEQLGYLLHLPVMIWYGVLAWRGFRRRVTGGSPTRTGYSASVTGSTSPSS